MNNSVTFLLEQVSDLSGKVKEYGRDTKQLRKMLEKQSGYNTCLALFAITVVVYAFVKEACDKKRFDFLEKNAE